MSNLTLTGVTLPDGTRTDLHVSHGRLVGDAPSDAERVDAEGLVALPGLVDLHTHLREPGREDTETVETGSRAAARGGFTCVHAMANTSPVTDTPEKATHILDLGKAAGLVQVVPVGAITKGLGGTELAELGLMHDSRAGVTVFSDDGSCVMDAGLMRRAFEWVSRFDGVLAQHAQDSNLAGPGACCHEGELSGRLGLPGWPPVAESVIIARDVQLAQATGSRLHVCHVSTAEGVEVIRWAKSRGIDVTAEVTPHHLYLTTAELTDYDTTYKVNPPLRTDEHVEALRAALADGTIDAVGTDHAPHAPQDKDHAFVDARPGMLGLEQALAVVMETMNEQLGWAGIAERMSIAPARIGRVAGQGRSLAVGEPANLVLVDPDRRATVDRADSASRSRNNPYHGRTLPDPVELTLFRGRVTHRR
ncbi:dihydroorotase [Tessaracoccus sp. OS52]|uniref:dihydroorotase n=1 Tax=Tessaracoccus sp. OS52 TaxID=2886691 RepID=UPI001D119747|nr:dihydroorotase [Tessaracoccus sp. OS52]MCC2592451.1 dihydroorotase [Tessaracoccus sp. OS52]